MKNATEEEWLENYFNDFEEWFSAVIFSDTNSEFYPLDEDSRYVPEDSVY